MNNDLISIIIPIYNCEKYISRCLDSILNQTYKNFEIICINDGSTDSSLNVVLTYINEANDNRIIVKSIRNSGPSIARNEGIKIATGKYITFVDSDDMLNEKYLEVLYSIAKIKNVKVVRCNYKLFNKNGRFLNSNYDYPDRLFEKTLFFEQEMFNSIIWNTVWGELIDSELAKQIKFDEKKRIGEDLFFNINIYERVESIYYTNERLYYYFENDFGITKKFSEENIKKNFVDAVTNYSDLYLKFKDSCCEYRIVEKMISATISYQLQLNYININNYIFIYDLCKKDNQILNCFKKYRGKRYHKYVSFVINDKPQKFKYLCLFTYIPLKFFKEKLKRGCIE